MKKDRLLVPDFLVEHIDTRGDPILPSRVVAGVRLVLRAGQSGKRLFSLLIPQVSDSQQVANGPERFEPRSVNDNCPYFLGVRQNGPSELSGRLQSLVL